MECPVHGPAAVSRDKCRACARPAIRRTYKRDNPDRRTATVKGSTVWVDEGGVWIRPAVLTTNPDAAIPDGWFNLRAGEWATLASVVDKLLAGSRDDEVGK